jgi:hypothetical protein
LTFQGRPVKRGAALLAYAERRKLGREDAVIELVNTALAQELHKRPPPPAEVVDNLGPVRDAMHTYEAAVMAGRHGGVAAAALVDAIYAILHPDDAVAQMPPVHVVCGVAESVERQRQQYDATAGEGWVPDDENPEPF